MSIVVSGGSSVIGSVLALELSQPGETVVLGYHSAPEPDTRLVERLEAGGRKVLGVRADLADPEAGRLYVDAAASCSENVRVLVHSSVVVTRGGLLDLGQTEIERAAQVNALSLVTLARVLTPLMSQGSSILYVSSHGARVVVDNYGSVGPFKALGESLVRYLAVELGGIGIRVNAISPGFQDTPAVRTLMGEKTDRVAQHMTRRTPLGRLVKQDDLVSVAAFLSGPGAAMVTGQTVDIDGGEHLRA